MSWTEAYLAYSSISEIVPDAQITPFFAADIELGQLLTVGSDGGGRVGGGGTPGAISILNQGSTPYTCGICVPSNGNMAPICAFPLYGNQMDTVTPLNRILLMFSSRQLPPGTVVGLSTAESLQAELRAAFTPMILIDLEGASEREVSFDINTGWDWGGAPWAQQEPANANLASLLIEW